MCNKLEIAVIRYEKARVNVSELVAKRSVLINNCSGVDTIDGRHGELELVGVPCGVAAWSYVNENNNLAMSFDEHMTYEDAFITHIFDGEGACDTCIEAYTLKHGDLAKARAEFGNAKRSLSCHGKRLIKQEK